MVSSSAFYPQKNSSHTIALNYYSNQVYRRQQLNIHVFDQG